MTWKRYVLMYAIVVGLVVLGQEVDNWHDKPTGILGAFVALTFIAGRFFEWDKD